MAPRSVTAVEAAAPTAARLGYNLFYSNYFTPLAMSPGGSTARINLTRPSQVAPGRALSLRAPPLLYKSRLIWCARSASNEPLGLVASLNHP